MFHTTPEFDAVIDSAILSGLAATRKMSMERMEEVFQAAFSFINSQQWTNGEVNFICLEIIARIYVNGITQPKVNIN